MAIPRPPQFTPEHATRWKDSDAAASYKFRPTYPPEAFDVLVGLMKDEPRHVLDVGCGTGNVSRPLASRVARIDAIDISQEMIDEARALPGGDARNINWTCGPAETAPLNPPYALVVGGEALHWMEWEVALPRFARAMTPNAILAVVKIEEPEPPQWHAAMQAVIQKHSTYKDYIPFDMIPAWENAGLFRKEGHILTTPHPVAQSVEDYIAAFHAMSALTRAHIDADAFDADARAALVPFCPDGVVHRKLGALIVWGKPLA